MTPPLPAGTVLASGLRRVNDLLQALPPDRTAALVASTRLEGGRFVTRTGFAFRVGTDWAFGAEAETDWHDSCGGEVFVRWAR